VKYGGRLEANKRRNGAIKSLILSLALGFQTACRLLWNTPPGKAQCPFEGRHERLLVICVVFEKGYDQLKEQGLKEARVLLLDDWLLLEQPKGDASIVVASWMHFWGKHNHWRTKPIHPRNQ
jgi:hypothetical protein